MSNEAKVRMSHADVAYPLRTGILRAQWGRVGRVVSGLLTEAAKAGRLQKQTHCGKVSGYAVWYLGEPDVFDLIRAEAAKRIA